MAKNTQAHTEAVIQTRLTEAHDTGSLRMIWFDADACPFLERTWGCVVDESGIIAIAQGATQMEAREAAEALWNRLAEDN